MSDKKQVHVILTAPYRTNRCFLARMLATSLAEKGITVDISNVPMIDIEPPVDVEKGPSVATGAVFYITEHMLGRPFVLESMPEDQRPSSPICKPALAIAFPGVGHGLAVIGAAGTGKSTIMKLLCECLNTSDVTKHFPQSIKTLGEEPLPVAWLAEKNVEQIKERVEVIFYVRRSKVQSSLKEILDGCDKPQVAEE